MHPRLTFPLKTFLMRSFRGMTLHPLRVDLIHGPMVVLHEMILKTWWMPVMCPVFDSALFCFGGSGASSASVLGLPACPL